ncbi:MAG: MFS transporter, partial [Streptomyces sp.]|nr:MFS transporter [Streptomyces sp.]
MTTAKKFKKAHPSATVPAPRGVSGRLVALLAVASGMTVANLYYAQPLLSSLSG